jgi:hypothetical protein
MKNLTKLTKAELISKLNNIKSTNKDNKDNNFTNFMSILLLLKSFILKFTLIALIIKIFKKYSIFRKIFTVINTILFSIFGISIIDIYEIEFLSKILNNILEIFSKFHINILELFGKKVETPSRTEILRGIQQTPPRIQTNDDESNRIIERFKGLINKPEEIKPDIIEETPFYKDKGNYIKAAAILILLGLGYYYWDDITPVGASILAWVNRFRSRPDPDSDGSNGDLSWTSKFDLSKLKDSIKNKFSKKGGGTNPSNRPDILFSDSNSDSPIGLSDHNDGFHDLLNKKGKGKDTQLTGFSDITGLPENFAEEGQMLLNEIRTFTDHFENDKFPRTDLTTASYNIISRRIEKWSDANPERYHRLINSKYISEAFNKFSDLHSDVNLLASPQSEKYNEVELYTIREQDIWSDKAPSPPLSPKFIQETAMDIIEQDKPATGLSSLMDRFNNLFGDESLIEPVQENDLLVSMKELSNEVKITKDNLTKDPLIEVNQHDNKHEPDSSNSSMDHYFPKVKPETIESSKKEVPNIEITNPTEIIAEEPIAPTIRPKMDMGLLKQINSRRLEYGSPSIANVGLPREDLSPLIINKASSYNLPDVNEDIDLEDNNSNNSNKQKEENLPLHDWSEEVKFKIRRGDTYERFIDFDFGNHIKDIKSIYVITNDGESYSINPNVVSNHNNKNSFKWDIKGTSNPYWRNLDICSITLIDKSLNSVNIYDNPDIKFLDNFNNNIGKGFR